MNATDLLPALLALALALLSTHLLTRRQALPAAASRFATVDGLRGYLAFGVFLHHGAIWNSFRQTGVWKEPAQSNVFVNLGQASVGLFFMVTAFLFFGRLLQARDEQRPIDWTRLFVGRVFRLVPVWYTVLALALVVVALRTGFTLQATPKALLHQVLDWMAFTFLNQPDINGLPRTVLVFAGVLWSLPYEWLFYLWLPALALLAGVRAPWGAWLMFLLGLGLMAAFGPRAKYVWCFAGGLAAAFALRWPALRRFAATPAASVLTASCLLMEFTQCPDAYQPLPQLLLSAAFVLIACGCDLFGLLTLPLSRRFGEPTYCVYLLHGLMLYVLFRCVMTPDAAAALTSTQHWLLLWALTPLLVAATRLLSRWVEQPGMALTEPATLWLKSRFRRRSASRQLT